MDCLLLAVCSLLFAFIVFFFLFSLTLLYWLSSHGIASSESASDRQLLYMNMSVLVVFIHLYISTQSHQNNNNNNY